MIGLVSFVATLAAPSPALAATASVDLLSGVVSYTAGSEANSVTVTQINLLQQRITDPGTTIVPNLGCVVAPDDPDAVDCTGILPLVSLGIATGSGDDSVTVSGTIASVINGEDGNDTLEGGEGADVLLAGAGEDLLRSRDTLADQVGCGSENDSVIADLLDVLGADCETIDNGAGGGTGGGGGGTGGGGGGTGGGTPGGGTGTGTVVIPPNALTATKTGVVGVPLRCQGTGICAGTLAVETARRVRLASQRRARKIALGSYQFSSRAASSTTVRVKLPAKLRKLLKRKRLLLRVTAVTRDSAGKPTTVTRTIVVKARRART